MSARVNAGWPKKWTVPDGVGHLVTIVGNGTGQPTQTDGLGIRLNRTGVGVIEVIWNDFPGTYMGQIGRAWQATTASQLKGFEMVCGDFDITNQKIVINIFDSTGTAADLTSTQQLNISFMFKLGKSGT